MRVLALSKRILQQIIRDKRTMALLIIAPMLVLTMLHLVFNNEDYTSKVGLVDLPEQIAAQFENEEGAEVIDYADEQNALADLEAQKIDGYVLINEQKPKIILEGSDPSVSGATMKWLQQAMQGQAEDANPSIQVNYLHGSEDMGMFDYFGPVLVGFFVFFFVFLIAGVSFLRERTTGTLERLLASPLRKWEIVIGYVLGFGLFTMIQATIIVTFAIYILDMVMVGAFGYVLVIALLLSLTALTLGILLSSFADNELQMMQFIPIVVVPQIFFSGLFNLDAISDWVSWIGPFTPLYYAAEALRNVMVRGYGWGEIYMDLSVLAGFSILFMVLNMIALRKYRKI